MSEINFGIGIPTINRYDLLLPALEKYAKDFPGVDIHIYDNGAQGIPGEIAGKQLQVYGGTDENLGVAASWNFMLRKIYEKYEWALILNDDIYLGQLDEAIAGLARENARHGIILCPIDWCAFLLPKKTFELLGGFDEKFYPAYYEDTDAIYRMKLAGLSIFKSPVLVPKEYKSSQTLEKNPERFHTAHYKSKKYYIEKWGGEPGREKYTVPFNVKPQKKRR